MRTLNERIQTCDTILNQAIYYLHFVIATLSSISLLILNSVCLPASLSTNYCLNDLMQVDETLELFNELQLQHQAVATKTKTLHDACDRLVTS